MAVVIMAIVTSVAPATTAAAAPATAPVPRVVVLGVPQDPMALCSGALWVTAAKPAS